MQWLTHNLITEMPGAQFLMVYGLLIALTFAFFHIAMRRADNKEALTPVPIPSQPDAYEVAYLRGGEEAATSVVLFKLVQRGYLQNT